MKKLFIILFIITNSSFLYAKTLHTSINDYNINLYNIAIVGNSHASYMSVHTNIDNDLKCLTLGNHSVAGNEFSSHGLVSTTKNNNGDIIGHRGDCKGLIKEFIEDSKYVDYAILFFGSNIINRDIKNFEKQYMQFLEQIDPNCKLILMAVPYGDYKGTSKSGKEHEWKEHQKKENIDNFSNIVKKLANKYDNCYYEEIPSNVTYSDWTHLDKKSYINIYKNISEKYNFPDIKIIKDVKVKKQPAIN